MWYSDSWKDYELIDTSKGMRLERWGKYILVRPDPQVIWTSDKKFPEWRRADAEYERRGGGGSWKENSTTSMNSGNTWGICTMRHGSSAGMILSTVCW